MVTKRSSDEIRENDIVSFIVTVRKLSCQTTDYVRNMQRIKNLANTIFRHYIGYTARGEYRLKSKDERCFSDEVKEKGIENPFGKMRAVNPRLDKLEDVDMVELVENAGDPGPAPKVEFVDLAQFEADPDEEGSLHRAGDEGYEEVVNNADALDEMINAAKATDHLGKKKKELEDKKHDDNELEEDVATDKEDK